jgi:hypothetical protein
VAGELAVHDPPARGTPFEYVLVQLEADGRLQAFFDAVDASEWFHLRHQLLLFSLATRYAGHPLVRRLLADLSARELAAGPHTMVPGGAGVGSVWLRHNPRWRIDVGDVFGEVDSVYITTKDAKRLKPAKADALRAALVQEHKAMAGELFKGVAIGDYDGDRFAREALGRALPKEGLADAVAGPGVQRELRAGQRRGPAGPLPPRCVLGILLRPARLTAGPPAPDPRPAARRPPRPARPGLLLP